MAKVTIDGKEYDTDSLSDTAKGNLGSLQFVRSELQRYNAQIAVLKTAEIAYATALKKEIDTE